ncbi:MAG: hypothetical protein QOG12_1313 [Verrucomicrobiota bacterium]
MMLPQPDVACADFAKAGPVTRIPGLIEGRCLESVLGDRSRVKFRRNSLVRQQLRKSATKLTSRALAVTTRIVTSPGGSRKELDSMVVEIELTLCSIIQGVALYFLVENARAVLSMGQVSAWPYVATGLVIILLFWSRSLIHTLTLIRWPLEFVHNFFYIACTLVEALAFTHLNDPFTWFVLTALYAVVVWSLFVYDMRLVALRGRDSAGPAGNRLYARVGGDQLLNIRFLIPVIFATNVASAVAIYLRPDFFLARGGHYFLITVQGIGLIGYLSYVIRTYVRLQPLIRETREEWRAAADE